MSAEDIFSPTATCVLALTTSDGSRTVAMPFDVPKTNVQSRWDTKVVGSYFPKMAQILKERGIAGFFNGLGPTLVRAFPANAALFLGVEMGKKCFDKVL